MRGGGVGNAEQSIFTDMTGTPKLAYWFGASLGLLSDVGVSCGDLMVGQRD